MTNGFPPQPVYPTTYDTDSTLYLVFNTSETLTRADTAPWAEEILIVPVKADKSEIWANNGFANISGELFYYDSVERNSDGKINKLKRCARNLGGKKTVFNPAGAEVRGFVIAEHHNQIVNAIINLEEFIGYDFTDDKESLDWRIRSLRALPAIFDDFSCPDVLFQFDLLDNDPAQGVLAQYRISIDGTYSSFRIDFGDGEFTTTSTNGTHRYAPNSTIDPVIVISNDKCQLAQTPIERTASNEPNVENPIDKFEIIIPTIPDIPNIIFPEFTPLSNTFNIPPIVFPCLDIGPLGPLSVPSVIVIDPPINIPSFISFGPVSIPSSIGFTPVDIPSLITFGPVSVPTLITFGPVSIPTLITFGPVSVPTLITFGPVSIPSSITLEIVEIPDIEFGPTPTIPSIVFGPAPAIPSITFGPAPAIPSIVFGPAPALSVTFGPVSVPSSITLEIVEIPDIEFGPAPAIPSITFGPTPTIPDIGFDPFSVPDIGFSPFAIPNVNFSPVSIPSVTFGPAPSIPTILFGPAPSIPTILFGPAPIVSVTFETVTFPSVTFAPVSIPSVTFGPAPSIPSVTFGPAPSIPNVNFNPTAVPNVNFNPFTIPSVTFAPVSIPSVTFGPAPAIPTISFSPAPSIPSITFGPAPSITVDWGSPPTVSCTVNVSCPTPSPMAMRSAGMNDGFQDGFNDLLTVDVGDIGIPSEIQLIVPKIPDIRVIHDIPIQIELVAPKIPNIEIIGKNIPSEIKIVGLEVPSVIELRNIDVPKSIDLFYKGPESIALEFPKELPMLRFDTENFPTAIKLVGCPSIIELVGPSTIQLVMPEKPEIEMVYKGSPIDVKIQFDVSKLNGKEAGACVAIVPCGS